MRMSQGRLTPITDAVWAPPDLRFALGFGASALLLTLLLAVTPPARAESPEPAAPADPVPAAGADTAEAGPRLEAELNYFSIITLTTVGYGDVSPVSPQARTLAALEGLIGQLYLAIIIAMIGLLRSVSGTVGTFVVIGGSVATAMGSSSF